MPIILIILASLLAGGLTFRDFGIGWDEPLFYTYANAIPYAYSIQARLDGSFDIEKAYGPTDHKYYGPAYLLMARPVVELFKRLLSTDQFSGWHLVNFMTFLVGVTCFYFLCLRWMSTAGALAASMFFLAQPVLWGHAFINPKDTPFMVAFIIAIYAGFAMVDRLVIADAPQSILSLARSRSMNEAKIMRIIQIIAILLLILAASTIILNLPIQQGLRGIMERVYQAGSENLAGRLFHWLAPKASNAPVERYTHKLLTLYLSLRLVLFILTGVFAALGLTTLMSQERRARLFHAVTSTLEKNFSWPVLRTPTGPIKSWLPSVLVSGLALGVLSAIRSLGPLAGVLVCLYFLLKREKRSLLGLFFYGLQACAVMLILWPYLWASPFARWFEAARFMSNFPDPHGVLFNGIQYSSANLPPLYLPELLALAISEPVWPLFAWGLVVALLGMRSGKIDWRSYISFLLLFILMLTYILVVHPPQYDGFRHFLFILPPVFAVAGLGVQSIFDWVSVHLNARWPAILTQAVILGLVAFPGITGIIRSQPYQYAYYNAFIGGIGGASRKFETDYWLTCYKEIMQVVNKIAPEGATIYVQPQPGLAKLYARPDLDFIKYNAAMPLTSGDLLLISTRSNSDQHIYPDTPVIATVKHSGATFCVVKQIK